MKQVTIMRGLPGSGKTTWVKDVLSGATIISADDYFMKEGRYQFDPRDIQKAHADCFRRFSEALKWGVEEIVVDNTNTSLWECSPYYLAAQAYEYSVRIIRIYADPLQAYRQCVHGVPLKVVVGMHDKFEVALPWWDETVLDVNELV